MTIVFGNADAEDAYDALDPPEERFGVLVRLRDQIAVERQDPAHDRERERHRLVWALKVIEELEESRHDLPGLDALELALLNLAEEEA